MYEYLRALHRCFCSEADHAEFRSEIEALRTTLSSRLSSEDRKLVLRLVDAQNNLKNEISLESFAAGFKLAAGISQELTQSGRYDYDRAIEEQFTQR